MILSSSSSKARSGGPGGRPPPRPPLPYRSARQNRHHALRPQHESQVNPGCSTRFFLLFQGRHMLEQCSHPRPRKGGWMVVKNLHVRKSTARFSTPCHYSFVNGGRHNESCAFGV